MDSKKENIRNYAKGLFLQVDANGNKVHTWDSISKLILKKFKLEIHFTTIQKWSKKEDWSDTFIKLKQAGIEKGKEQYQEKENKLIDEKSQVIADIYKSNKQILSLAKNTLLSRLSGQPLKNSQGEEITPKIQDANLIHLLEHAEDVLLNLHDKNRNDNGGSIKQVFVIGGKEIEL
jgi:hypothetical protein